MNLGRLLSRQTVSRKSCADTSRRADLGRYLVSGAIALSFLRYQGELVLVLSVALGVVASFRDIVTRRIPNRLTGGAFLAASGLKIGAALAGGAWLVLFEGLAWAGGLVGLFYVGWVLRLWGAGDAKLAVIFSLLLPPIALVQLDFILGTMLIGGVLAGGYLWLARRDIPSCWLCGRGRFLPRRLFRIECWRARRGGGLPYGVAISLAGILTALAISSGTT